MSEAHIPRQRSPAEWSYLIRRGHILRAIRHPALTPAAKQVLVALAVAKDDHYVLPERPPVKALAQHLALAERTVRQAIAELVEQNCLTFRVTGEGLPPGQGAPDDPEARPDLAREWAFLSDSRRPPTLEEYLDTLARLRDHAIAAKRIATAVSAERALGRALLAAERMRRAEAAAPSAEPTSGPEAPLAAPVGCEEQEAPLDPPHESLRLVARVSADRALAPSARHALIEVLLDRPDHPVEFPEDDRHLSWAARIARRHGITVRGARKALAELEDLRIIAQAKGDVCVYENRLEERLRRGTHAPQRLPVTRGLAPLDAHVHRLARLRELAVAEGLAATALAAHNAIGRALGLPGSTPARKKPKPKPAIAAPAKPPKLTPADILPTFRGIMASAPDATEMMFEICAEIEAETAGPPARPPADAPLAAAL
ncbi:MAG TPA: hypothetical protein VEH84_01885 [Alphaproteobacteria bacterium]|nr:hypothetical protein [Alphaproteobacteria bacterium]